MSYTAWSDDQLVQERTRLQILIDESRASILDVVAEIERRAVAVDTRIKLADLSDETLATELERRKNAVVVGVQLVEGVGDTPREKK